MSDDDTGIDLAAVWRVRAEAAEREVAALKEDVRSQTISLQWLSDGWDKARAQLTACRRATRRETVRRETVEALTQYVCVGCKTGEPQQFDSGSRLAERCRRHGDYLCDASPILRWLDIQEAAEAAEGAL